MACENIPSIPVASLTMMLSCLYELVVYYLAGVLLPHYYHPLYYLYVVGIQ